MNDLPKYVNIRNDDCSVTIMPYVRLKDHEEFIIEDNICYGILHCYEEKEINDYEKAAYAEWKDLKNKLRENPNLLLTLDKTTERYIPYTENTENQDV